MSEIGQGALSAEDDRGRGSRDEGEPQGCKGDGGPGRGA